MDLTSIYCEIHEILIICHFLESSSNLCVQVSGCWLQESGEWGIIVLYLFSWNNWYYLLIHITLYIYLVFLNSPVTCLSIDLIQSQTCCSVIRISSFIINPQYFCVNLWISMNIVRISSLNIVKSSDLLDCYPFIVWFFQY